MNSLADFKRAIKLGTRLHTEVYGRFACVFPDRQVTTVQTNSFACETEKKDGTLSESWLMYPKASLCKFDGDSVTIHHEDGTAALKYTLIKD